MVACQRGIIRRFACNWPAEEIDINVALDNYVKVDRLVCQFSALTILSRRSQSELIDINGT